MLKRLEISVRNSCLNRAMSEERVFVLLERDVAAAATIRFWAAERIRLGKNVSDDPQIIDALTCADSMAKHHELQ